MAEDVTPNGLKCPECGKGELVTQTRTEEFDFDFGEEPLRSALRTCLSRYAINAAR